MTKADQVEAKFFEEFGLTMDEQSDENLQWMYDNGYDLSGMPRKKLSFISRDYGEGVCPVCGKTFSRNTPLQLYDTKECSKEGAKRRVRGQKLAVTGEVEVIE